MLNIAIKPSTWIWFILIAFTLLTLFMGQMLTNSMMGVGVILTIAFLKSQFIIDHFMGLKNVRYLWRILMLAWLVLVLSAIAFAYYLGLSA